MSPAIALDRSFRISALPLAPFKPLFALSDAELEARGMRRVVTAHATRWEFP